MSPVILLSDGYISHLYETIIPHRDFETKKRDRQPLGTGNRHFQGLSHEGFVPKTSDVDNYRRLITRLHEKQQLTDQRYNDYEYIECSKDADTLLVSYGALSRIAYHLKTRSLSTVPYACFP